MNRVALHSACIALLVVLTFTLNTMALFATPSQSTLTIERRGVDSAGRLHISVKNTSEAPVTAFTVRYPDGQLVIQEFLPPKQTGILPGESYDFVVAPESGVSTGNDAITSYHITAVLRTDGATDGSTEDLNMMFTLRAGRAYRLRQVLPVLEELQHVARPTYLEHVEQSMEIINTMPLTLNDGTAAIGLFANGMQNVNTLTLHELRKIVAVGRSGGPDLDAPTQLLQNLISSHRIMLKAMETQAR